MKTIAIKQAGGADQLKVIELDQPKPQADELLIKVEAAGINRLDLLTRERQTDHPEAVRLGVEIAGVVVETAKDTNFSIGDRVMGLVENGGYSEYAVIPANRAMPIPAALSFVEAAAIPEVFQTAYQTLFWLGNLQENESVLIHAGASGVGTAAIQLAKQLRNAQVIVTAGSKRKLDFCKELGADVLINYKEQAFDQEIMSATNNKGVDLILDFVGASYWDMNLASIKTDGRWVVIGTLGGSEVKQFTLAALMQKRIQLTGTLLTPRDNAYKSQLATDLHRDTHDLFEKGMIKPIVDTTFEMADVAKAHQYMEANKNIGKIILTI